MNNATLDQLEKTLDRLTNHAHGTMQLHPGADPQLIHEEIRTAAMLMIAENLHEIDKTLELIRAEVVDR